MLEQIELIRTRRKRRSDADIAASVKKMTVGNIGNKYTLGLAPWNKGLTGVQKSKYKNEHPPWLQKEKHFMFGKQHTEASKQKNRDWHILHPNRKFSNTKIEQKIAAELTKRNIEFKQNIGLCNTANVDFYLPEHSITIQADGCYWHGCPTHNPSWIERRERDARQDAVLISNNFKIYRFWEHEIDESVERCINSIRI